MHITALYTYPIKSCGALSHTEIELDARGPVWDRRWMLVDDQGMFLTAREYPALARVQPAFEGDDLTLTAPGFDRLRLPLKAHRPPTVSVQVWRDVCDAWDEGDEAAQWFSDYLRASVRLVRMADLFTRALDPNYATDPSQQTGFADGFPLLIAGEASLAALNQRLAERGKASVPMSRFRPNVVIGASEPFAEDTWRTVRAGTLAMDVVKPCARCVMTTVDPETGQIPDSAEPLATLNTFRRQGSKVMFAQNAVHRAPGTLRVGQPLEVVALQA